ncbi:MAG: hypothetical protein EPO68_07320, partial [Planctomycetota bacterium]
LVLLHPADPRAAATARTDASGTCRWTALAAGRVVAEIPARVSGAVQLRAGAEERLVLRLPEGLTAKGRVVDAQGRAVSNAELWVASRVELREFGALAGASRADGSFELQGLRAGAALAARRDDIGTSAIELLTPELAAGEIVLALDGAAATIDGRVVDEQGRGVPDALVVFGAFGQSRPSRGGAERWHPSSSTRTDATGSFRGRGVALTDARTLVWVVHAGHGPAVAWWEARGPLEIRLARGARVAGRVTGGDGAPLAHATIRHEPSSASGAWRFAPTQVQALTTSDADGAYELADLPPGAGTLSCELDEASARVEATWQPGETRAHDFVLVGAAIDATRLSHASVIDARARPADRLELHVAGRGDSRVERAETDARGRFELALPLGAIASIDAYDRATDWPHAVASWTRESAEGLVLELPYARPPARITARVAAELAGRSCALELDGPGGRASLRATIASDGRVESGPLPAGSYELELRCASLGARLSERIELGPGEVRELGWIELLQSAMLLVEVPGGERALVVLSTEHGQRAERVAGTQVRFDDLPAGRVSIAVIASSGTWAGPTLSLAAGADERVEIDIRTSSAPAIEVDLSRLAPGRVELRWSHADGSAALPPIEIERATQERALFHLRPGSYSLAATHDGARTEHAVEVGAGGGGISVRL